jgi:hypothetical protein
MISVEILPFKGGLAHNFFLEPLVLFHVAFDYFNWLLNVRTRIKFPCNSWQFYEVNFNHFTST